MPIIIPNNLPANRALRKENIFVMNEKRAERQDIRPLKIAIFNIMPDKITTETQLLRLLSNNIIQIEITLLRPKSHRSKNTAEAHLETFYRFFSDVKSEKFDGLIITGAPVEQLPFEKVDYWGELETVLAWSTRNVTSTLHICWGAQAGLYYFYGIHKYDLPKKMFGVFQHRITEKHIDLPRGFDDFFMVPQSRHTEVRRTDIEKIEELKILAESNQSGVHLISNKNGSRIFVTGHFEYDAETLGNEYERDLTKGIGIELPQNYFPENNPRRKPIVSWRSHANLFFSNWLNYYVYQATPYDLS